jgi:hypothetical protein
MTKIDKWAVRHLVKGVMDVQSALDEARDKLTNLKVRLDDLWIETRDDDVHTLTKEVDRLRNALYADIVTHSASGDMEFFNTDRLLREIAKRIEGNPCS